MLLSGTASTRERLQSFLALARQRVELESDAALTVCRTGAGIIAIKLVSYARSGRQWGFLVPTINWRGRHLVWYLVLFVISLWLQLGLP